MADCPMKCMLPCMVPCMKCPNCCNCPMNCVMDCCMAMPCCTSSAPGGMASPMMAKAMQPMMRYMMDGLMHVTEHYNDATYKEVQDFMVPESSGKTFVDAPGTFKEGMEGRTTEVAMGMMGMKVMKMSRVEMIKGPAPHNKGITWEKFSEHRGYALPGYEPKHPKPGDKAPDGKILAIDGSGNSSTLLTEAKKMAAAAGSDKVILCFDAITCPFFRAYAAEDLYKVANGVPQLHVYLREAEPCDVFDAGGMHCVTPLKMKRYIPWHKTEADRALAANDTKTFLESFEGKGKVNMWMDTLDDTLEALYEARPWRWYVVNVSDDTVIACTGLAPFNMAGKLDIIKKATAPGSCPVIKKVAPAGGPSIAE
jgi:hypothetical protein